MVQVLGEIGELQDIVTADPEVESTGEAQEGEATETTQETQDFEALYKQTAARLEKVERDQRSQAIQRTTQQQRDARNALMEKTMMAMANRVLSGEVDSRELPQVVKDGIASYTREEATLSDVASWIPAVQAKGEEITSFMAQRGWTMDRPEMGDVKEAWNEGVSHGDKGNAALAKAHFDIATRAFEVVQLKYPAGTTGGTRRGSAQSVNAGGARSTGGGLSAQQLVNKYGRGENLTPEQVHQVMTAMDNGIYPD